MCQPRSEADVEVRTADGEVIEGRFKDDVFLCDRAQLDLPLDEVSSQELLLYLMPWLSEVSRRDAELDRIEIVLEDFEFRFLGGTDEDSGSLLVNCPPLRVKLEQKLAARLGRNARERAGGWLHWDPAPMRIRLDRLNMFYDAMEVPLPGGGVATVTGNAVGREYSLAGEYPGSYVAENLAPDQMFSAELDSNRGTPRLNLDPIDLKVTDIARIIQDEFDADLPDERERRRVAVVSHRRAAPSRASHPETGSPAHLCAMPPRPRSRARGRSGERT